MGIVKHSGDPKDKTLEEGYLNPLTGKSQEKTANKSKGFCEKLRTSTVPLVFVLVGATILVTVILILSSLSVRTSTQSDKDLQSLEISTGKTLEAKVVEGPTCVQCMEDWVLYRGTCYYFSDQSDTWNNSQNFCKSQNSSLAIICNEKELKFLNLLKSNKYWIGLSRTQDNSGWVWTDGTLHSETL
ncbi:natural killer cells antigen CD94-like isoform X1 [Lithobates pipiens]